MKIAFFIIVYLLVSGAAFCGYVYDDTEYMDVCLEDVVFITLLSLLPIIGQVAGLILGLGHFGAFLIKLGLPNAFTRVIFKRR